MAKRKNQSTQDDELLVDLAGTQESAQDFIEKNQTYLFYGLLAIVLLAGGYFAYKYLVLAPKQEEAVAQMFKAQEQFERDSFKLALTEPGGNFPGFVQIADDYSGTKAGNTANYYAGVSYLQLGNYEAAIAYLSDFSASGDVMPIMKNGALGDAHAESGDLAKAMSFYQKAVSAGDNEILTAYYLKKVGMLNEKNGNKSAANAAYSQIRENYPNSPEAGDIDKYIFRTKG